MASKTMRVYEDGNIRYTYMCNFFHEKDRYCKITYPDGTSCYIYDKKRLIKQIELNRYNTYLGYLMEPKFILGDYIKQHFGVFRKNKINELMKKSREKTQELIKKSQEKSKDK